MTTHRTPHPTRSIFKSNRIRISQIAAHTGRSYYHIAHVLTGYIIPSEAMHAALYQYARQVDPSFSIPSETIL